MGKINPVDSVIDVLLAAGWVKDRDVGRVRFTRPGTDLRCTVGKRSVSFYHLRDGQALGFANYSTTKELEYVQRAAREGSTESMPETPGDVAYREACRATEERHAILRADNERRLQEQLDAGERVLISSGQRGQVFVRSHGVIVVLHSDPQTEIEVCCLQHATWLSYPTRRGRCPVGPDDHAADCAEAYGLSVNEIDAQSIQSAQNAAD